LGIAQYGTYLRLITCNFVDICLWDTANSMETDKFYMPAYSSESNVARKISDHEIVFYDVI